MAQAISPILKVDCTRAPVQCNENKLLKNPITQNQQKLNFLI